MLIPDESSTPEKLADIQTTKTAIREAIVAKGVDVPEGTTFQKRAGNWVIIGSGGRIESKLP